MWLCEALPQRGSADSERSTWTPVLGMLSTTLRVQPCRWDATPVRTELGSHRCCCAGCGVRVQQACTPVPGALGQAQRNP